MNLLGGWVTSYSTGTVEDFWRRTLPSWGYSYTRRASGTKVPEPAATTTQPAAAPPPHGPERTGSYCTYANTIYLDYWGQQGLLDRLGDHASGGFLAHKWAHRAQQAMGTLITDYRREYNADCMAGLYTRFGYNTGRLNGGDYWEFYNWLYHQPSSGSHGTGVDRAAWYQYGYTQYTNAACDAVLLAPVNRIITASVGTTGRSRNAKPAAARRLQPPLGAALDTTPRRSNALPAGAKHIRFPKSRQHDVHTPVG